MFIYFWLQQVLAAAWGILIVVLGCGSRLQSLGAQQLQPVGLSCFTACGASVLPPGVEPTLSALEVGPFIPGHQGRSKPSTSLQLQPSVLLTFMILGLCWYALEDGPDQKTYNGLCGFAQVPERVRQWLALYMGWFLSFFFFLVD